MPRATIAKLIGLTLVLSVITSVIMLIPEWNGVNGSVERDQIDVMLDVMIVISSFVFSIVIVMMGWCLYAYRAKPGDESDGEPIHGNSRVEFAWTAIPTVIVLICGVYAAIVLEDIEAKEPNAMPVQVTAQQFAWRFDYPDQGVTSTELHVPDGQQIELELTALDVLHSFWVPEWGIKRDLVPAGPEGAENIDNKTVVTPDLPGTYSVICTELCGLGHTTMRATAVVESQAEFDKWIADQAQIPKDNPGTGAAGGKGAGSLAGK